MYYCNSGVKALYLAVYICFTLEIRDVDNSFCVCLCFVYIGSELLQVVLTQRSSCGMLTQQVCTLTYTCTMLVHTETATHTCSCLSNVCMYGIVYIILCMGYN